MSSEIAIKVEGLSKCYQIYDEPRDRLKQFVFPRLQHLVGMEQKQYFREFWAVKDVSFTLNRGASLGILGLNGAGKSTLLQMICGTLAPTMGNIYVNGRIAALLELGAGFNPEFTGLENIYLNGAILGLSESEIEGKIGDILFFADIGDFINQPVKTYSSGMYVRLAFSIAIHSDPDILVIDEALAVGDFMFQQKCNLFMKDNLSNVTKLFVSHDIGAVANMTDTALVLQQGRLIFYGDAQLAIQEYQIASRAHQNNQSPECIISENNSEPVTSRIMPNLSKNEIESWADISSSSLSGTLDLIFQKIAWNIEGQNSFSLVRPGDLVNFSFEVQSNKEINSPIVGYQAQDRFGVVVFGENSKSSNISVSPIAVGKSVLSMNIRWPEIANGKYSITIGVGSGMDSEAHEIICWAHNVVVFDSVARNTVHGIFNNKIIDLRFV